MTPRVISSTKYKMASPMYIGPPIVAGCPLKAAGWTGNAHHPVGMNRAQARAPRSPPPAKGDSSASTTVHHGSDHDEEMRSMPEPSVPEGPIPLTSHVLDVPSRPADAYPVANGDRPLPFTNAVGSMTRLGLGAVGMVVSTITEATGRVAPTGQSAIPAGAIPAGGSGETP